jgi:hypothetical protein
MRWARCNPQGKLPEGREVSVIGNLVTTTHSVVLIPTPPGMVVPHPLSPIAYCVSL